MKKCCVFITKLVLALVLLILQTSTHPQATHLELAPKKILILGNSITKHLPDQSIGWNGNWGMAASSEDKDYVHLLIKKMKIEDVSTEIRYSNVAQSFERKFWVYDSSIVNEFKNYHPDLIIFRLGENIKSDSTKKYSLCDNLLTLSDKLSSNKPTRIIITSRFWPDKIIDTEMRNCAATNKWGFVNISDLFAHKQNTAQGKFINNGVSIHPSDEGMEMIFLKIYAAIKN
ncbi:SGNH/GDSL hydrolase family protein [Dyadobacter diqingensis]|uniref:SGNH/GDSL hydrolase family protein n=1 Tax=Dyadobacter diqingensis TaxID=2938121 RepID=UPI0020C19128|nr:SGNH/GDSL hydrolase family protein [Dyadobacter diqingensis]